MQNVEKAEDYRKGYKEQKEKILSLLSETSKFYSDAEDKSKVEEFETLSKNLQNDEFSIVVVGEFSSGKSTMLNALMHKRILPSYTGETTATVNFLRHKGKAVSNEAGKVFYNDGREELLSDCGKDTIEKFVSTKGKDVAKTISHLDLYLDSEFLKDGVTLVDSPGLNGIAEGHREITEEQIQKSNASIFLFSSDHPGTATDFQFLGELTKKVPRIFFVLNKIDQIQASEGETAESVINGLKQNFKKALPEFTSIPEIWPISAGWAMDSIEGKKDGKKSTEELYKESRLSDFESRLLKFLTQGEKSLDVLRTPVKKVLFAVKESSKQLEEEKKILESKKDSGELEAQIAKLNNVLEELKNKTANNQGKIKTSISSKFREIKEEFQAKVSKESDKKLNYLENIEDKDELVNYIEQFQSSFLHRVSSIANEEELEMQNTVRDVISVEYADSMNAIEGELVDNDSTVSLNLKVDNTFQVDEGTFTVGLEEMQKRCAQIEEELKVAKEEAKAAGDDYLQARSVEKKQRKLEEEIRSLRDEKNTLANQMLPPIQHRTEQEWQTHDSGGFFGWVHDKLVGKPGMYVPVDRAIATDYNDAKQIRDESIEKIQDELEEKNAEYAKTGNTDSDVAQARKLSAEAEVQDLRQKLQEQKEADTVKINETYKKEIRHICNSFRNYCDDITDQVQQQIKVYLRENENKYVSIVSSVVEANVKKEIQSKAEYIKSLKDQLLSSEADKNKRLGELDKRSKALSLMKIKGEELYDELDVKNADQIEQISL